ncbi:MAG: class I SAM-dependent methyltransferase [Hymenobacteraceae bacterium]|nr:class I SAM-dependent methyltransferase [Hymenobacteraceae bacterium]
MDLSAEAKKFIAEYLHHDPAQLALQARKYADLPVTELIQQIAARQKAFAKLPSWSENLDLIFPVALSVEQASSELTAAFKASLVHGELLIDLTGGFGIDATFFARSFKHVTYIERNTELAAVVAHNVKVLGIENVTCINTEATAFLADFSGRASCIYLDPARRGSANQKLHLLQDCEPDVLNLLPTLLNKSNQVLLKTSPMLDIDLAVQQLGHVAQVWVISVDNDCKEVLYLLQQQPTQSPVIKAFNLHKNQPQESFSFTKAAEEQAVVTFSEPQQYVYEPNAAVMKAGAFKTVALQYGLYKLHPNSHLYTSNMLVPHFPGRVFTCVAVSKYNKKELLQHLPQKKANIAVRNFPDTVAGIRKKTGIKDGGDYYLFATTDLTNKPVILICHKA